MGVGFSLRGGRLVLRLYNYVTPSGFWGILIIIEPRVGTRGYYCVTPSGLANQRNIKISENTPSMKIEYCVLIVEHWSS